MELSCHCGNIKITTEKPEQLTECNCSICSRYASLWGYFNPDEPIIEIGTEGSASYSWGDNELDFVRCAKCGCVTHYQTKPGQTEPMVAINFGMSRSLVSTLPVRQFNGAKEL